MFKDAQGIMRLSWIIDAIPRIICLGALEFGVSLPLAMKHHPIDSEEVKSGKDT